LELCPFLSLDAVHVALTVARNSFIFILNFLMFCGKIDISHQELCAAQLDDVTLLQHIIFMFATLIKNCFHDEVHALAHLVGCESRAAVLIVKVVDLFRLNLLNFLLILGILD